MAGLRVRKLEKANIVVKIRSPRSRTYFTPGGRDLVSESYVEFLGMDITVLYNAYVGPMTRQTRQFYNQIKAVSSRIDSLIIRPGYIQVRIDQDKTSWLTPGEEGVLLWLLANQAGLDWPRAFYHRLTLREVREELMRDTYQDEETADVDTSFRWNSIFW